MDRFNSLLLKSLSEREANGALRKLKIVSHSLIDFSSNDYLGLARSVALKEMIAEKIQDVPYATNGSTGSRLLSGNTSYAEEIEKQLATFFKSEAALIFTSGYTANLSVLSSIPKRGDTILYDQLSHASIKDGIRLSQASRFHFRHNDVNDLEKKLKKISGNCFVVIESIYSMDGDSAPLSAMAAICEQYGAHLVLDEAHSTGVQGENGNGLACELNLQEKVPVRIYTFGKAMGVHGACVAGSKELIHYLINFARPFIYTTAPDNHSLIAVAKAFDFLNLHSNLQQELKNKVDHFLLLMSGNENLLPSKSAIQSFIVSGNCKVKAASEILQKKGFDVRPILAPTVEKGKERLRIILHTFNTMAEIEKLAHELKMLASTV
jgi:8-amino-7-oxononanoate synthase